MKLAVEVELDKQVIVDLLTTAFEGGSNYWLAADNYNYRQMALVVDGEVKFPCRDIEDGVDLTLTAASIRQGLKLLGTDKVGKRAAAQIVNEDWDAETADIFLQLCLLGKVVYG